MKTKLIIFIASMAFSLMSFGQLDRVTWEASTKKIDANTYQVNITASLEDGWYIYSQYMEEGGPIPTKIKFDSNSYTLSGKTEEKGPVVKENFDDVFEINVKKFGDTVTFSQLVKVKNGKKPTGQAKIKYMSCNDVRCNPPKEISVSF